MQLNKQFTDEKPISERMKLFCELTEQLTMGADLFQCLYPSCLIILRHEDMEKCPWRSKYFVSKSDPHADGGKQTMLQANPKTPKILCESESEQRTRSL